MRVILYALGVLLIVLFTWLAYVSIDEDVPFARLELTALRIDARRAADSAAEFPAVQKGRVLVSFSWRAHTRGSRCVRVDDDLRVAVGGVAARAVRRGGGSWSIDDGVPLPFHKCVNEALYEVDRALLPGNVAASLGDGRGNPALIVARDLMVPPSVVVVSPQPAHANERATLEVLPDTLALSRQPLVQRGASIVSPVDVEANRLSFTVPTAWTPGDAPVRIFVDRTAAVLRCERAPGVPGPPCFAFAIPVDDGAPFVVEPKR